MSAFQWNQINIDWFNSNFKDYSGDIKSRNVQRKYGQRGCNRREERLKPNAQDFNNLMRLVVHAKLARVTNSHVNSKKYRIRMVSDEQPYTQEIFNKELFDKYSHSYLFRNIQGTSPIEFIKHYSGLEVKEWDVLHESVWDECCKMAMMYADALVSYNYLGGDFDKVFIHYISPKLDCVNSFITEVESPENIVVFHREEFCTRIHSLVGYYKLLSSVEVELLKSVDFVLIDGLRRYANHLFVTYFDCVVVLNFINGIEQDDAGKGLANRTLSNKLRESIKQIEEGAMLPNDGKIQLGDPSTTTILNSFPWLKHPSISNAPTLEKAAKDWMQIHLEECKSMADRLRKS